MADEALLASPPLTSGCLVQFLTGRGPLIHGPGVGDPWYIESINNKVVVEYSTGNYIQYPDKP